MQKTAHCVCASRPDHASGGRRFMSASVELLAPEPAGANGILTPEALAFIADLHTQFASRRDELLARRAQRAAEIATGAQLGFLPETASIRTSDWTVAPAPADLNDRR